MKLKSLFFIATIVIFSMGCASKGNTSSSSSSSSQTSSSSSGKSSSSSSGQTKVTVAAHTLSDTNPPIDINSDGEEVDENTWDSFRYGSASKFYGNYNFTYTVYNGTYQVQRFTKKGYSLESVTGNSYYELKSGSTFYQYVSVSDGYLRQETSFDIKAKYTDIILHELYVHMYDYSEYEYHSQTGWYTYQIGTTATYRVMFQDGYLTMLSASISPYFWTITLSFDTTIDIPKSYYY